jgi:hypothetical protein
MLRSSLLLERRGFGDEQANPREKGTGEAAQPIPDRFRLFPKLSPFGCAALRAHVFLQDTSTLIREDLVDLKEPLQSCAALAPNDEVKAAIETTRQALTKLEQDLLLELEAIQSRFFDQVKLGQMVAEVSSESRADAAQEQG